MNQNYDLEERTLIFAKNVREFVKLVPRTSLTVDDIKQLIRSSGSVGANYIEANESLSKKDFLMRAKICRKEAKESIFWLKLIDTKTDSVINNTRLNLLDEATQLMKIFGSIIQKSQ